MSHLILSLPASPFYVAVVVVWLLLAAVVIHAFVTAPMADTLWGKGRKRSK